ncbi:GLPGLI family protein [Kaistella polysaccharea]|uniref:GLPGLI family protein n=1 Tax=Kaistella polysaccharea TaxID=2878534 RepID=UPI001CF36B55|nr:GLPGLI family protein [Kaistella polysaccharea]
MKYLIFLLFPFLLSAQTHRFIYEVNYKRDSTENTITKDYYHLDIAEGKSSFYHRDYFILDSLLASGGEISFATFGGQPKMSNVVKHDLKTNQFRELELMEYEVFDISSEAQQKWNLKNETKIFQKMTLQKAETNWGGRKWTAWFAKLIPFNSGPYKFYGLPGLIVELKDDRNNFQYQLIKSENYPETKKIQTLDDFPQVVAVNYSQYKKKMLSLYEDPLGFINTTNVNFENSEGIFLKDNTLVKADNVREVRKAQQIKMRRFNNPVELDKIIDYPVK